MPLASLLLPSFGDLGVHRVGDAPVGFACRVLVDQRGPYAVVSHPLHEVAEAGRSSRIARQVVTGVPQVVEVEFRYADGLGGLVPPGVATEVAPPPVPPLVPVKIGASGSGPT